MAFNPNAMTFAQGIQRIQTATKSAGLATGKIVTSRDAAVQHAVQQLAVTNVPPGFSKWQLPVYLKDGSQFFFSYVGPNVSVPQHSHDEGDGLRVIVHGSIHYEGEELRTGDWMFIPKGKGYTFSVGPEGAGMFYCYECCCA